MARRDPIETYVRELGDELRAPRRARRRLLREVRAHLHDAVAAGRCDSLDTGHAAERALARFGPADEMASQFNRLPHRRRVLLRRALVPWLAAAAVLTTSASASVWAFQPGSAHSSERQSMAHASKHHRAHKARAK
jgi:HAAS